MALKDIIEDSIDEVMSEFNDLEYVKKWYNIMINGITPLIEQI